MSLIIDAVKAAIPPESYSDAVEMVGSFAFLTTVKTKRLGICMTLSDDRIFPWHVSEAVRGQGELQNNCLKDFLAWSDSPQGIERSFSMAAINSALPINQEKLYAGNALQVVGRLGEGKRVCVVGHFPGMDMIRKAAAEFSILEKRPQEGDLQAEDAVKVIPAADVIAITGVTCLNDTLEGLLSLKKNGAIVVMVGASVPLSSALFDFGVDLIGGTQVIDDEQVYIQAAHGGTPRFLRGIRYAIIAKDLELVKELQPLV